MQLEAYILAQNTYQVELINNTDKLPEAGALLVASWPKAKGASGFPARLFAILPRYASNDSNDLLSSDIVL